MSVTIPIVSASGAKSTVTVPDPVVVSGGDVIWKDKFASAPTGVLSSATANSLFLPVKSAIQTSYLSRGAIVTDPEGGKLLRHTLPPDDEGEFIMSPQLDRETDHATLQYSLKFDPNFDWQLGGKLGPGLVGVRPGYKIYDPTSGNTIARTAGFSTRLMWHGNNTNGTGTGRPFQSKLGIIPAGSNDIVTYCYTRYPDGSLFDGYGWHKSLGPMSKGEWHTIKQEVRLNTPGVRNGVFKVWIDGQLKYSASDWDYRAANDLHIQAVLWDVHRGGGMPLWASKRSCYIDIKNVSVTDLA